MDSFKAPDVITTLKDSRRNFVFHAIAYRHLSEREMYTVLRTWMRQKNLKHIPRDVVVDYVLTIGLDE